MVVFENVVNVQDVMFSVAVRVVHETYISNGFTLRTGLW